MIVGKEEEDPCTAPCMVTKRSAAMLRAKEEAAAILVKRGVKENGLWG